MATIAAITSIGAGVRYALTLPGDSAYVPIGNTVVSTNLTAIEALSSSISVTVAGDVYGNLRGVDMGGDMAVNSACLLRVLASGSVASDPSSPSAAARILGANSAVYNEGSITGGYGVLIGGSQGGTNTVTNTGTISGNLCAVRQQSGSSDTLVLWNYGSVLGQTPSALSFSGDAAPGAASVIHNRGLIRGDISLGDGDDVLDNRDGSIDAEIHLGDGRDIFDNRGGAVTGTVYGGGGDDTFVGSTSSDEIIDGGDGADLLDFRNGSAVSLALDGHFDPSGAATGDDYLSIENIHGSRAGDDVIWGNGGVNHLFGNGADDELDGRAGADVLSGGRGADLLTGGEGNDRFRFHHVADFGDTITDFSSTAAGNNDSFAFVVAGLGGGLAAGGALLANQFQSRADNLAQDADDRFIFRTTDRSLWFDADGTGTGAAIMVADLQAGAVVTTADILLV